MKYMGQVCVKLGLVLIHSGAADTRREMSS